MLPFNVNLIIFNKRYFVQYHYQLFFKAIDKDGTYDAVVDYSYSNFYYPSKNYNYYTYMYGRGAGSAVYLFLRHKWYCPASYYETYCTKYCVLTDSLSGHYSCDSNGNPVCLDGWTGASTYCTTGTDLAVPCM